MIAGKCALYCYPAVSTGIQCYPVRLAELKLQSWLTTRPRHHRTTAEDHGTKAVDQFLTEGREGKEKAARVPGVDRCKWQKPESRNPKSEGASKSLWRVGYRANSYFSGWGYLKRDTVTIQYLWGDCAVSKRDKSS